MTSNKDRESGESKHPPPLPVCPYNKDELWQMYHQGTGRRPTGSEGGRAPPVTLTSRHLREYLMGAKELLQDMVQAVGTYSIVQDLRERITSIPMPNRSNAAILKETNPNILGLELKIRLAYISPELVTKYQGDRANVFQKYSRLREIPIYDVDGRNNDDSNDDDDDGDSGAPTLRSLVVIQRSV